MRPLVVVGPSPLAVVPEEKAVKESGAVIFTIVNGVPPYTIASSDSRHDPSPAHVTHNGGEFTVDLRGAATTVVTYTITDSTGAEVTAKLTVTG